ncbi:hypothetical protein HC766_01750 [Candidatus Gracilibacteria bacterium]|nr:hypothetical protein [Candidatus Gracilibacteria bacterium]NJS41092.1 hypothetical protein [Candidatus Gracilibacteria bacterium]
MENFSGGINIDASEFHTLLLKNDNTVWSTGLNTSGQLGHSPTSALSSTAQVPGLTNIVYISAG